MCVGECVMVVEGVFIASGTFSLAEARAVLQVGQAISKQCSPSRLLMHRHAQPQAAEQQPATAGSNIAEAGTHLLRRVVRRWLPLLGGAWHRLLLLRVLLEGRTRAIRHHRPAREARPGLVHILRMQRQLQLRAQRQRGGGPSGCQLLRRQHPAAPCCAAQAAALPWAVTCSLQEVAMIARRLPIAASGLLRRRRRRLSIARRQF